MAENDPQTTLQDRSFRGIGRFVAIGTTLSIPVVSINGLRKLFSKNSEHIRFFPKTAAYVVGGISAVAGLHRFFTLDNELETRAAAWHQWAQDAADKNPEAFKAAMDKTDELLGIVRKNSSNPNALKGPAAAHALEAIIADAYQDLAKNSATPDAIEQKLKDQLEAMANGTLKAGPTKHRDAVAAQRAAALVQETTR